jgi:uncharacterized protein (DUF302 family)
MPCTIDRLFPEGAFDAVAARTRAALAANGFGVLTEIDMAAVIKARPSADLPAYLILGACNPKLALSAIEAEPKVGAMLPCNVIVRRVAGGVEVSAIDPAASMMAIDTPAPHAVAGEVRDRPARAIAAI